jgi:hypothetical protein
MKKGLLFFLAGILIASCGASRLKKDIKIENLPAPPGTTPLEYNLYFDQDEITNFNWLEFLYWTEQTYGVVSEEYKHMLPDTMAWAKLDSSYEQLAEYYLRHAAYRDYPVVGISYKQAKDFCKWRSDRVMEYLLVQRGIFEYKENHPADSAFTIEKYFRGEYYGIRPDPHFRYYPHYSLPDSLTFYKAIAVADSINPKNRDSCRKKSCNMNDFFGRACPENLTDKDIYPYSPDPAMEVSCYNCKKDVISHLKGNVREMTDVEGLLFGASFRDSCSVPDYILRTDSDLLNSYTGFRAKCEYRKWGE